MLFITDWCGMHCEIELDDGIALTVSLDFRVVRIMRWQLFAGSDRSTERAVVTHSLKLGHLKPVENHIQ